MSHPRCRLLDNRNYPRLRVDRAVSGIKSSEAPIRAGRDAPRTKVVAAGGGPSGVSGCRDFRVLFPHRTLVAEPSVRMCGVGLLGHGVAQLLQYTNRYLRILLHGRRGLAFLPHSD